MPKSIEEIRARMKLNGVRTDHIILSAYIRSDLEQVWLAECGHLRGHKLEEIPNEVLVKTILDHRYGNGDVNLIYKQLKIEVPAFTYSGE